MEEEAIATSIEATMAAAKLRELPRDFHEASTRLPWRFHELPYMGEPFAASCREPLQKGSRYIPPRNSANYRV